jgi:hypothetical protein
VHVVCRVLCTNGTSIDEGRDKYEALSVARECADHVVSFPVDKWVRLASSIGTEQRAQLERALARLATLFDEHPDMSAQDARLLCEVARVVMTLHLDNIVPIPLSSAAVSRLRDMGPSQMPIQMVLTLNAVEAKQAREEADRVREAEPPR